MLAVLYMAAKCISAFLPTSCSHFLRCVLHCLHPSFLPFTHGNSSLMQPIRAANSNEEGKFWSPATPSEMAKMLQSDRWYSQHFICLLSCGHYKSKWDCSRDCSAVKIRVPKGYAYISSFHSSSFSFFISSCLVLLERMRLMLADISVGAKTPGMVAKVDAWRHKLSQANQLGLIIFCWKQFSVLSSTYPTVTGAKSVLTSLWHVNSALLDPLLRRMANPYISLPLSLLESVH